MTLSVLLRIVLWVLMLVGGTVGGIWLDLRLFPGLWHSAWWHAVTLVAGMLLMRLVFRLSRNTGRTLARNGREGRLPRLETNRLVTTGVYGCMRHPMHFGLLFMPLALALIIGSPSFIFLVAPLEMLLMIALVLTLEEAEVSRKFGERYRVYRRDVPAFSLSPVCLKQLFLSADGLDETNNGNRQEGGE